MRHIYLFSLFVLIISCSQNKREIEHLGKKNKTVKNLSLDSIKINSSNTSNVGVFFMGDTNLFFGDKMFASLYRYDLNGKLINRKVGKGRGPKEIPAEPTFFPLHKNDKYYLAYDDNNILYKINKNSWEIDKSARINFHWTNENSADPTDISFYEPTHYSNYNFKIQQIKDSLLLVPIEYRDQPHYFQPGKANWYYNSVKTFGLIDRKTHEVKKIVGGFPSSYNKNDRWRGATGFTYTLNKDTMYVTHFPDSLIYVYKYPFNHPDNLLYTIGFEGKNMNKEYPIVTSKDEGLRNSKKTMEKHGFYFNIKYIKKTDVLFRTYQKGSHTKYYGMQIYKDKNLIGDVKVPNYFNVLGYQNPYYYGVKFYSNQFNQKFTIYKFKLNQ